MLVCANWKMNTNVSEGLENLEKIVSRVGSLNNVEVSIFPPFTHLDAFKKFLDDKNSKITLGAQNIHSEEEGAYTGEISCRMIQDFCKYVIIGHSERRLYCLETNKIISKKLQQVQKNNLTPILCIGETKEEKDRGEVKSVLETQLTKPLEGYSKDKELVIAYEPVWAIGTGITPGPEEITVSHLFIKEKLLNLGISEDKFKILYGGSTNENNVANFAREKDVEGFLVGGTSLVPEKFIGLCKNLNASLSTKGN